jgi:hypothetical protein
MATTEQTTTFEAPGRPGSPVQRVHSGGGRYGPISDLPALVEAAVERLL